MDEQHLLALGLGVQIEKEAKEAARHLDCILRGLPCLAVAAALAHRQMYQQQAPLHYLWHPRKDLLAMREASPQLLLRLLHRACREKTEGA